MKTLTKFLSIIFIITLTQSCSKDTSCGNTNDIVNNYNISADDKSKIPFKGNDTLVYISNAGDTAVLIGTGKKTYIDQIRKNVNNVDCPIYTVDNNETISIEYNGNNPELFKVMYKIVASQDKTRLIYAINNYIGSLTPYYFNEITFYSSDVMINNKNYKGRQINLLDSVNIIYNKDFGFLKIEFVGGKTWLLKI